MNTIDAVKLLEFPRKSDKRGNLVIIEGEDSIPFKIERVFFMYGMDLDTVRGDHANRESEFVFINLAGSCKIKVKDAAGSEKIFELNRPDIGLYLPQLLWKTMYDFSNDSILLVLASTHFDENEYLSFNELKNN